MVCLEMLLRLTLVVFKQELIHLTIAFGFMQNAEQIVTPTVARASKSTRVNINKLKVYLSNEKESRPINKQVHK